MSLRICSPHIIHQYNPICTHLSIFQRKWFDVNHACVYKNVSMAMRLEFSQWDDYSQGANRVFLSHCNQATPELRVIVYSDNGLFGPGHNLNRCWFIDNRDLLRKLQWIFNNRTDIFIPENVILCLQYDQTNFLPHCHRKWLTNNVRDCFTLLFCQ